jgi:hypothetical protein
MFFSIVFVDLGAIVASECRFSYRKDFGTLLRPRSAEFLFDMGIAVVPSAGNLALQIVARISHKDSPTARVFARADEVIE